MVYYAWKSYKLKIEPLLIFEALKEERNCFFLDSSLTLNSSGRYTFIGIDPFYILEIKGQEPFERLRQLLRAYKITLPKIDIPFLGGAVGILSYDLGFQLENKLKRNTKDDLKIPDCFFGFYNSVIICDNIKRTLYIFSVGFPEKTYGLQKSLCSFNMKKIHSILSGIKPRMSGGKKYPRECQQLKSNFSRNDYLAAVKKAKQYIKCGDIYQVNLSQRFQAQTHESGFGIYRRLRSISPSCFGAYFDAGGFQILSASPERFLKVENNTVITSPMKGTRPRGKNTREDSLLRKELLASDKDKAELTMIVDLERNDLGRVCEYDSIKVDALRQLEKYNTVFQTTATVRGRLHKDKDRIDLLKACFPGGSITGCPKIRAMQIIEELEPSRRSIYTGCLGYLSFSGGLDFNILIRTILKKDERLYFGVGGGIVADSEPEAEYQETLVKAKAMIEAIQK